MENRINKDRLVWLDIVRSIAIIGVILCHVVGELYGFTLTGMQSEGLWTRIFAFTVLSVGRIGVPFFLLATGYLLLDRSYDDGAIRKFWNRKLLGLLFAVECFIVIYHVFLSVFNGTPFSVRGLAEEMLFLRSSPMNHMWYMPMILGMYLLLPLVANGLATIGKETVVIAFLVLTILFLGIPSINIFCNCLGFSIGATTISVGFSGGVYGLYIVGGYLIKKGMLKKVPSLLLALGSGLCLVVAVATQLYAYRCGVGYNLFYGHIVLLVGGMCLFEWLSRVKKVPAPMIFSGLSRYSFGIYLIHNPVNLILQRLLAELSHRYLKTILISILTLGLSFLIAFLIAKIPKIGKKILYMR